MATIMDAGLALTGTNAVAPRASGYTVVPNDVIVPMDTTGAGAKTVNLPNPALAASAMQKYQVFAFPDPVGNAAVSNIQAGLPAGVTLDGLAGPLVPIVTTNHGCRIIYTDGVNYFTLTSV